MHALRTILSTRRWNGAKLTGAKYFSQRAKTGNRQPPITIIAIMSADCHLLVEEDARLNGRRNKANAATMRMIPTTGILISTVRPTSTTKWKPTIEFDAVMQERLGHATATGLFGDVSHPLGLAASIKKDDSNGCRDNGDNNTPRAKGPSPSRAIQVPRCRRRTGERVGDEWACGKGKKPGTILQARRIGDENVEDVIHAVVSDPEEHLRSAESVGRKKG